jgi:hypothetical protein
MREFFSPSEKLKRRMRQRPKGKRFEPSQSGRGVVMTDENITFIPADCKLRMLRDQLVIEPMDVLHSRTLIVPPHRSKLVRGKIIAAGPGLYPNRYADKLGRILPDGRDKSKRALVLAGTVFRPVTVKVGQIVHLDGRQTGKGAFEAFYWGDKYCLHAREEDVAGVEE